MYSGSDSEEGDHGICSSCGKSIHDKKTKLPIVYVFGKKACGFATRAKELVEDEKKRPGSCIDTKSVYIVMAHQKLENMQPVFETSPRVYVDYSHASMEDISVDNKNFLGGYTELLKFVEKQRIHAVDSVIQEFVATNDTTMFMLVAADWCGYCKELLGTLHWDKTQGHAMYHSKDAAALCITTGKNPLISNVLRADGVIIEGYPTLLEYSSTEHKWVETEDQDVLRNRSWSKKE